MMIGRTRLAVGPLRDLGQLDATIACIGGITGVGAVAVDTLDDRRAMLALQVLRPLDLESELRAALGPGLVSCGPRGGRLELVLRDPDAPAAPDAATGGDLVRWSAPRRAVSRSERAASGRRAPAAVRRAPAGGRRVSALGGPVSAPDRDDTGPVHFGPVSAPDRDDTGPGPFGHASGRGEPEWPDPAASPWAHEEPTWAATATARLIGEEPEGAPGARGTAPRRRTTIRGFLVAAQG